MADPLHEQRIPFGKNGVKDGNGRIIRTDHPTLPDILNDLLPASKSRKQKIDKTVKDAVDGIAAMKAIQDKIAGITRRT